MDWPIPQIWSKKKIAEIVFIIFIPNISLSLSLSLSLSSLSLSLYIYIYMYIYIYIYVCVCVCINKLVDLVEGDSKSLFSLATTARCREERYSLSWIVPLIFDLYLKMLLSKEAQSYTFWIFGMARPVIEPRSSEPLADNLPAIINTSIFFLLSATSKNVSVYS